MCVAITAISAFVSLAFSLDVLNKSDAAPRVNSMYAVARSLALAVVAAAALLVGSTQYLKAIGLAMAVVQAADAVVGITIHDRLKTIGPAVTSLANALALVWLYASS